MDIISNLASNHFISSLAITLVHFCWQAILIALFVKVILTLTSKRLSQFRYYAAISALLGCCFAPIYTFYYFYNQYASQYVNNDLWANGANSNELASALSQASPQWTQSFSVFEGLLNETYLVVIWGLGVLLMLTKFILEVNFTYRLSRTETSHVSSEVQKMLSNIASQFGILRRVRILKSGLVTVPVVIGWLKPTILLPVAITIGMERQQLELIIAHELAHVKRFDFLTNLLQNLIQVLFFYHPCVYWINKMIREEREYICDSMAIRVKGETTEARMDLAKALLSTAELKEGNLSLVAVAASDGHLKNRVSRILLSERQRMPLFNALLAISVAVVFSFAAIAATGEMEKQSSSVGLPNRADIDSQRLNVSIPPQTEQEQSKPAELALNNTIESEMGLSSQINPVIKDVKPAQTLNVEQSTKPGGGELVAKSNQRINADDKTNIKTTLKTPDVNNRQKQTRAIENKTLSSNKLQRPPARSVSPMRAQRDKLIGKETLKGNRSYERSDSLAQSDINQRKSTNLDNLNNKTAVKDVVEIIQNQKQVEQKSNNNPGVVAKFSIDKAQAQTKIQKVSLLDARIEPVFIEPLAIVTPFPTYPSAAYSQKLHGSVKVEFVINENGRVTELDFEDDVPRLFIKEIQSKLRRWRYEPATKDGNKVAHRSSMYFEFELPSRRPFVRGETGSYIKRGK